MAEYLLAEEKDLVLLPDSLSYSDGAQIACGFGTVYEGLEKISVCGNHDLLIVGLGPVGLASAMLARALGARRIFGVDIVEARMNLAREKKLCDYVIASDSSALEKIRDLTNGNGVERAVDCSGNTYGRQLAIQSTRKWGKIVFIGEGGSCEFAPSPDIIHGQKTIYGSWVTNLWRMEELVERIERWGIRPEELITHRFSLEQVAEGFTLMNEGQCGKVAICFDEELK